MDVVDSVTGPAGEDKDRLRVLVSSCVDVGSCCRIVPRPLLVSLLLLEVEEVKGVDSGQVQDPARLKSILLNSGSLLRSRTSPNGPTSRPGSSTMVVAIGGTLLLLPFALKDDGGGGIRGNSCCSIAAAAREGGD